MAGRSTRSQPAVHPAGAGRGDQLLRHRQRVLGREQRGDRRTRADRVRAPRRDRARHQGARPDARRPERRRPVPQGDHDARSTTACAGSAPTTSTCTRSTAGIPPFRSRRPLEALHDVVKAGKARYLGASSMWAWQFAKALLLADANGWTRFSTMQNHYNLLYREEEREMLPLCLDQGVGVIPWSPLARGRLTRDWDASTKRSQDRPVRQHALPRQRQGDRRPGGRGRRRARRPAGTGRARLGGCGTRPSTRRSSARPSPST